MCLYQMVFFEHVFSEADARAIEERVFSLRLAAPAGASGENVQVRSTNGAHAWWRQNPTAQMNLAYIERKLVSQLSDANRSQIFSTLMLIRNVRSIVRPGHNGRSYINRQSLHINRNTSPTHGEAFMQIIYYIDTPRYANGRPANDGNRGQLLVSNGRTTRRFNPIRGHAVYFTPTDTWHEVLSQTNSNRNVNVNRKMIIMMLYKRTNSTNTVSEQIRGYHPKFLSVLHAIGGHVPRPTMRLPNNTINSLSNMLRGLTIQNSSQSRSATARNKKPKNHKRFKITHRRTNDGSTH